MAHNRDAGTDYGEHLTYAEAADILGCHISNVPKLIRRRELTSHGGRGTKGGSLDRAEVEALAESRRAALEAHRHRTPAPSEPRPDELHDWLTTAQAAELLGVTPQAVAKRLRRGRLPGAWHGHQWWMQRQHVLLEIALRERRLSATRSG